MRQIQKNVSMFVLIIVLLTLNAYASRFEIDRKGYLMSKGFQSDTIDQITEATKSKDDPVVRIYALEMLKERAGKEAIPVLKNALDDEQFDVRRRAARYLNDLNDKSGIKRMRRDLKEFAPNNGEPAPADPNVTDPSEIKRANEKRNLRLLEACRAGYTLAEMGDSSGYQVAARLALEGEWPLIRGEAVKCLASVAVISGTYGMDPVFILKAVAETEKDKLVLQMLSGNIYVKLDKNTAIEILEVIKNARDKPEVSRDEAKGLLKIIDKRDEIVDKHRQSRSN